MHYLSFVFVRSLVSRSLVRSLRSRNPFSTSTKNSVVLCWHEIGMEKGKIGNHRTVNDSRLLYRSRHEDVQCLSIIISLPASMLLTLSFCMEWCIVFQWTECKLKPVIACVINGLSCAVQIDRLFLGRFIIHDKIEPFYNINIVFESFLCLWDGNALNCTFLVRRSSLSMKSMRNKSPWMTATRCFPLQFPVTIAVYSSQRLHWRRSTVSPVQLTAKSGFAFIYGIGRSVAGI